jgi:uncharacterized protein (DUF934 family)
MPLIRNGAITEDKFRRLTDDEPMPEGEPVLISLKRWLSERDRLISRNAPVGVVLKSSEAPAALEQDLARLSLIAIEFPGFRDGRGFSYAQRLRTQMGYEGELRAFGHILPDQALFLTRVGFDTLEVKDTARHSDWQRGLSEISVWYQPAADMRVPVLALRQRKQAAE